ncbi:LysR family transcriptional regulator [Actinoplanes sichuanensis]|uniref:LysR family transcriptional regulator n=1 Tax=Actinoplanes sichuanensis TaxID=512349 RepID=A0ABW4A4K5_9ACTN|nr:LysR family transcriptional regulator [Actinoplanes sichuanensis]BEL03216.1 LysR family transcriptional regulator [Actinoplanes sichuanensis]
MGSLPEVEDLRLVSAVARLGSVGAAARELLISQPSASQRLAALERRVGERLFVRDPTGARPTGAGREMAARAEHILRHLASLVEQTRAAVRERPLTVGTFASLAPLLFPALGDVAQVADHGDRLIGWVAEGSLDVAVVAIAEQVTLPPGVVATPLGRDDYAVLFPEGVAGADRGKRPYRGRRLVAYTFDLGLDLLVGRLAAMGAQTRTAATAETAVRLARVAGIPAVLPRCLARMYVTPGERLGPTPIRHVLRLALVSLGPPPELGSDLGRRLGLRVTTV